MVGKLRRITEPELEKRWIHNLSRIEKGLKLLGRQLYLKEFGQLDLLCKDHKERYVVVELKAPEVLVDESIISQTFRYRTGVQKKYAIDDPTRIRILCFVHKVSSRVRMICEQAGIGIVTYDRKDLRKLFFPEATVGNLADTELRHAVLPVGFEFFQKLDRFCWFDVKDPLKWLKPDSTIVFYSKKRLMAEAKVERIERKFVSSRQLDRFLRYSGYFLKKSSKLFPTVIFYSNFRKYSPPVMWESFLQKFAGKKFSPIRRPRGLDSIELQWIQGKVY